MPGRLYPVARLGRDYGQDAQAKEVPRVRALCCVDAQEAHAPRTDIGGLMMADQSIISQVRDEGYRAGYEQASMLTHDDAYIKGFDDATRQADGLAFTGLLCGIALAAFIWGLWAAVFPSNC